MDREKLLEFALAALVQMVNDYGHTKICWDAQRKHGVQGCNSDACMLARKALDIEHLTDPEEIRERLDTLERAVRP